MRAATIFLVTLTAIILITLLISITADSSSTSGNIERESWIRLRERRQVLNPYYDFLINEWSFKFWAVFQLVTIAVLFYSCFAALYYAKYTYLHTEPTPEDFFLRKRALDAGISRWGKENRKKIAKYKK